MQERLEEYLRRAAPQWERSCVTGLKAVSAGWECDVYAFKVEYGPPGGRRTEDLVLRVYQGSLAYDESAHEFQGMTALHNAGYPVPDVLFLERDGSALKRPFTIMELIFGEEMWPLLFPSPAEVVPGMLDLFVRLLAGLHTLDYRPFLRQLKLSEPRGPFFFADRELANWEKRMDQFRIPGFRSTVRWLESHKREVPCAHPSVIHWDFHPGNILADTDGDASVIDWTGWDVSDARFDLAWTLLLISTQRDMKWRDVILSEYERRTQTRVDGIEYFEVAACLKRLFFTVVAFQEGPGAIGLRPDVADMIKGLIGPIGKVYDILLDQTDLHIPEVERLLKM